MPQPLGREIIVMSHRIRRYIDAKIAMLGITGYQARILHYIEMNDEVYQKDIEEYFHIRRSSVTSVLSTMEKNGLIERVSVKKDARLKRLVLTSYGKSLNSEAAKIIYAFDKMIEEDISESQKEVFYNVLEKITKNMGE